LPDVGALMVAVCAWIRGHGLQSLNNLRIGLDAIRRHCLNALTGHNLSSRRCNLRIEMGDNQEIPSPSANRKAIGGRRGWLGAVSSDRYPAFHTGLLTWPPFGGLKR